MAPIQLTAGLSARVQANEEVLARLRSGHLNLVCATAMAEEGLDIAQCQLVVRFDLPQRPVEFIQSRGRARAADSRLMLMVEAGKTDDLKRIDDCRKWGSSLLTMRDHFA